MVNAPVVVDKPVAKSIEIYATLPKKKSLRTKSSAVNAIEDEEYMLYDRPTQRTGLFGRAKRCDDDKKDKKRARSEERNKNASKDFSIAPSRPSPLAKNAKVEKKETETAAKNQQAGTGVDQKGKKQHKIRRKLLMGGLIKRKNRSMPDLREGTDGQPANTTGTSNTLPKQSVDDSNVGLKGTDVSQSLSGYLSEGHLEFSGSVNGSTGNPNLERSRLMRKSFHGSAGKVLHVAKVPPPPPLRTTSQLSKSKCSGEVRNEQTDKSLYPLSDGQCNTSSSQEQNNAYWSHVNSTHVNQANRNSNYADYSSEQHSLPFIPNYGINDSSANTISQMNYNNKPRIQDDVVQYANGILYEPTFVVTRADVHSEQSPVKQPESLPPYPENGNGSHSRQPSEEFPPPPYPVIPSVSHSRQPSEDFPPPPPPIEDQTKDLQQGQQSDAQQISSLLAQLQLKRDQMLAAESTKDKRLESQEAEDKAASETWLRELQAKQAEMRMKKQTLVEQDIPKVRASSVAQIQGGTVARRTSDLMMSTIGATFDLGRDVIDCPRVVTSSVKDMAAKFEQIKALAPKAEQVKVHSSNGATPSPIMDASQEVQKSDNQNQLQSQIQLQMQNQIQSQMQNQIQIQMQNQIQPSQIPTNHSSQIPNQNKNFDPNPSNYVTGLPVQESGLNAAILSMSLTLPHENGLPVDYPEDDISEVAMQNTIQNTTILPNEDDIAPRKTKRRIGKKKSVSFCDQVVLVATAEDDEKDSYIPNPILERVLRSAMQTNKPETAKVLREIRSLQEAELNRENAATKFQQHTLPLKSEADSIPSTPFQDQLRSVNPVTIPESNRPTFTRQNSNDSAGSVQEVKTVYGSYGSEGQDMIREAYSSQLNATKPPTSYSPQLQQQIRYSQNGYPQFMQTQSGYPQTQTAHPRNQGVPLQQKPASPYTVQMHNFPQNGNQQKVCAKNGYQTNYYQMEQQHNQMNKQITQQQITAQQQATLNQRLANHNLTHNGSLNGSHNGSLNGSHNGSINSNHSSPITVQHSQQQFSYPPNQSPNAYQQFATQGQYPQVSYQGHPYQSIPQQRPNQSLPQYQPPPTPGVVSHQQQHQHQQQVSQNGYLQRLDNYQRPPQKFEQQNVLAPNQTYPNPLQNGQIQSNMKYPTYQHPPAPKQNKQTHFQSAVKGSAITQATPVLQKTTAVAAGSKPCHLCGKKSVAQPAIYCTDCECYMSRFRPKN